MSERKLTPHEVRIFYVRWHAILGKAKINNELHAFLREKSDEGDIYSVEGAAMEAYYSIMGIEPKLVKMDMFNGGDPAIKYAYEYEKLKYTIPAYVTAMINLVKNRSHDWDFVKEMIEKHCENQSVMSISMCKPINPAAFWRDLIKRYVLVYSKLSEDSYDVPFVGSYPQSTYTAYYGAKQKIGDQSTLFVEI